MRKGVVLGGLMTIIAQSVQKVSPQKVFYCKINIYKMVRDNKRKECYETVAELFVESSLMIELTRK